MLKITKLRSDLLAGCNHMTCRKESCKYEFCWLCLDNWKLHAGGFFKCNKFESGKPVEADKLNTSRASLQKYLFYFNRYANHNQSLILEKELHKRLEVASFTFFCKVWYSRLYCSKAVADFRLQVFMQSRCVENMQCQFKCNFSVNVLVKCVSFGKRSEIITFVSFRTVFIKYF